MKPVLQGKSADKLVEMVRAAQLTMRSRHDLMDEDLDLLNLRPFMWEDEDTDWATYTSNDPQVFFRKFVSWIAGSTIVIESPYTHAKQDARDKGRATEKFFRGIFNIANDIATLERVEPPLLEQMGSVGAARGFVCGLGMLRLTEDYRTLPVIQVWDPRHTYWGFDDDGLAWACYVQLREEGNIFDTWDVAVTGAQQFRLIKGQRVFEVFDFYDRERNVVVVDGKKIKDAPHGALGIPVAIQQVGPTPMFLQNYGEQTMRHFGESIFAPVRDLYREKNRLLSMGMEMSKRTLRPAFTLTGPHGAEAQFDSDAPDISESGAVTPIPQGSLLNVIDAPDLSRDWAAALGECDAAIQRATFPNIVYGQSPGTLSGVALNQLGQGVGSVLQPVQKAVEAVLRKWEQTIRRQYASGNYTPVAVSGRGSTFEIFHEQIMPEVLLDAPAPMIRLKPVLPYDQMHNVNIATTLKGAGYITTKIGLNMLDFEAPDDIVDQLLVEKAETGHPIAVFREMIRAMYERGDIELADLYVSLAKKFAFQEGVQIMALAQAAAQGVDSRTIAALLGSEGMFGQPSLGGGEGMQTNGQPARLPEGGGTVRGSDPAGGGAPAGFNPPAPADERQQRGGRPRGSPTQRRGEG